MGEIPNRFDILDSHEYQIDEEKLLENNCGITAIYNLGENYMTASNALKIGSELEHRGQQGAGVVFSDGNKTTRFAGAGRYHEVFTPQIVNDLEQKFRFALIHCRYGTSGGYENGNIQPIQINEWTGIHNGNFNFSPELTRYLSTITPNEASDSVRFMEFLSRMPGDSADEKIMKALDQVDGFYNLCIGHGDNLYIARDQNRGMPFFLGKTEHQIIAASETCALDKAQATIVKEIRPGEVLRINQSGITQLRKGADDLGNFCGMQTAYFMRPDSLYNPLINRDDYDHPERWSTIADFRTRCGIETARELDIPEPTFVMGIPSSGIFGGVGFATEKGWRYEQALHRKREAKRIFQTDNDSSSFEERILNKYSIPNPELLDGADIVYVDDSIVRGNTSLWLNQFLRKQGVNKITIISLFPEIRHTCNFGVSIRKQSELVAFQKNRMQIAEAVGADDIHYISHGAFAKAYRPKMEVNGQNAEERFLHNGLCPGCTFGRSPLNGHLKYSNA